VQFAIRGVHWPPGLQVQGRLGLSSPGTITLGENVTIVNSSDYNRAGINHPTQLVAAAGASLRIGNRVGISGVSIYCFESITIGNHVLLGVNCNIFDGDFHAMDYLERRAGKGGESVPVIIEDDVWLGANVTVLKGVTVGARSVIGAGSVVTRDIPADSFAAGSPARIIRTLTNRRAA